MDNLHFMYFNMCSITKYNKRIFKLKIFNTNNFAHFLHIYCIENVIESAARKSNNFYNYK